MKNPDTGEDIDPAAAAVIAKARRIMIVIMSVTFAAVGVVIAIIGYRVSTSGERATAPAPDVTVNLPRGARVLSTAVTADRIAVTVEVNGVTEVRLFDAAGRPVGRIGFGSAP